MQGDRPGHRRWSASGRRLGGPARPLPHARRVFDLTHTCQGVCQVLSISTCTCGRPRARRRDWRGAAARGGESAPAARTLGGGFLAARACVRCLSGTLVYGLRAPHPPPPPPPPPPCPRSPVSFLSEIHLTPWTANVSAVFHPLSKVSCLLSKRNPLDTLDKLVFRPLPGGGGGGGGAGGRARPDRQLTIARQKPRFATCGHHSQQRDRPLTRRIRPNRSPSSRPTPPPTRNRGIVNPDKCPPP